MAEEKAKLCRNKKTGAIFWWNPFLANDPDIEIIEDKQAVSDKVVDDVDNEKKVLNVRRKAN